MIHIKPRSMAVLHLHIVLVIIAASLQVVHSQVKPRLPSVNIHVVSYYGQSRNEDFYEPGRTDANVFSSNLRLPPALSCDVVNNCDINAQCVYDRSQNTHKCQCRPGYGGDGYSCRREGTLHLNSIIPNPAKPRHVVCTRDSFENNFGIKHLFTNYLKKDCGLLFDRYFSIKYVPTYALVKKTSP